MADSTPAAPRGRVLLIDDDRVFGLWATRVLESRGLIAQHVLDPMSGLKHIETEPWDVVITDVEMPRMSGIEFLGRVRQLEPSLPVVVVTAHPTVDRAVAAMRQPFTDFIHKPVSAEEFAAKVLSLVAQREPAAAAAKPSVLAIGAHPGDVEIGAAGALLAHQAEGLAVTILTIAPDTRNGAGEQAGPGVQQAGGDLGTRLALGDLLSPGDADPNSPGGALDRVVAEIQPTVLYTHSIHDGNPDHRDTHNAAMAAARRIGRVYGFQSPSATLDFRPTHFVAIDEQLSGKLRAVGEFTGQDEVRAFLEPDQVTTTALYWARYCQAQHAEAFEVLRDG